MVLYGARDIKSLPPELKAMLALQTVFVPKDTDTFVGRGVGGSGLQSQRFSTRTGEISVKNTGIGGGNIKYHGEAVSHYHITQPGCRIARHGPFHLSAGLCQRDRPRTQAIAVPQFQIGCRVADDGAAAKGIGIVDVENAAAVVGQLTGSGKTAAASPGIE